MQILFQVPRPVSPIAARKGANGPQWAFEISCRKLAHLLLLCLTTLDSWVYF